MKTSQYVRQEKAIEAALDTTWYVEQEAKIRAADAVDAAARRRHKALIDDGHIYVVEFVSGVVKVGKTMNPKSRLASHAMYARIHGGAVRRSWLSEPHRGCSETERLLIAFCKSRGVQVEREYFREVHFEVVRELGQRLAHDARRSAYLNALIEAAGGDLGTTWQDAHEAWVRTGGEA